VITRIAGIRIHQEAAVGNIADIWSRRVNFTSLNRQGEKMVINRKKLKELLYYDQDTGGTMAKIDNLIVQTWTCVLCETTFYDKDVARRHPSKCDENPAVMSCGTCRHYSAEDRSDGLYTHVCGADPGRNDVWLQYCRDWQGRTETKTK